MMKTVVQVAFLAGALLLSSGLRAQTQPPASAGAEPAKLEAPVAAPTPRVSAPPSASSAQKAPPGAPVEMTFERTPQLSHSERATRSDSALSTMRSLLNKGLQLSATARREKDVVRLNCVQEKVTAMKALLRVAEQASVSLQEAATKSENDAADYEYQRVRMAQNKAQQISAEANSCVGEVAVYTGPVQVVVDIDPALPAKDPTLMFDLPTRVDQFPTLLDRPQALSPSM